MRKLRSCKVSQSETLSAYVDGMLDGTSMRDISHHLDACSDCQESIRQLTAVKGLLQSTKESAALPGATFWADAYRKARLTTPPAAVRRPPARSFFLAAPPKWRLAGMVAIGCTAIGLAFVPASMIQEPISESSPAIVQSVDVQSLVGSHASLTAFEPLADHSRLTMVESEMNEQQADGGDTASPVDDGVAAATEAPNAGAALD